MGSARDGKKLKVLPNSTNIATKLRETDLANKWRGVYGWLIRKSQRETSLVVRWLWLWASTTGSMGSVPGWGTENPHIAKKKIKKWTNSCTVTDKRYLWWTFIMAYFFDDLPGFQHQKLWVPWCVFIPIILWLHDKLYAQDLVAETLIMNLVHKSSIWANPQELDDPVPSWCTHLATRWTTIQCWLLAGSSAGIHWRTSVPFLLGLPVGLLVLPHSMVAQD